LKLARTSRPTDYPDDMSFDVALEIHSPGLDLDHGRWNNHVMFMDEVHAHASDLARKASEGFRSRGRGTLWIGSAQWMAVIEGSWEKAQNRFPCEYRPITGNMPGEIGRLGTGFEEMLTTYDPESQVVLTVLHHPGDLLSAYLLTFAGVRKPSSE
jgi:hypothetical protein